ncbi:MarR family winged helix-turn-helix transcriptional regulator [Frigidibacter sp. MR17.24]|uniref:MarR family winged helix-turn-helix transcriptional regulator n=1 Tax=Frigidibacter sp. MR17.24 TaxID=3127345 RepID=UPI003012E94F
MADAKLTEQIGYLIARANRLIEDDLAKRLQPGGIAIEQFRVLKSLEQVGPLPMGQLAERVLVEPATLTKIIDRMVREQLVVRQADPDDRRKVRVALAPAGAKLCSKLGDVSGDHEQHIAETFSEDQIRQIRLILGDIGG